MGAELAAYAAGDKKAQNGSSVSLHTIPLHAATATECDKKTTTITKRACQLLKFWIHVLDQRDKHLLEIWRKNKVLIKSYGEWN